MGQYGDQQQGHCQGTSKAFPHDGNNSFVSFLNSSSYDTVILGMDYNESGDSNLFSKSRRRDEDADKGGDKDGDNRIATICSC